MSLPQGNPNAFRGFLAVDLVEILSASSLLPLVIAIPRDRFSRNGVFVKSYSLSLLHENRTRPKGLDSVKEKITATKKKRLW